MKRILRCDCLPERIRWSCFAYSGQPAVSREEKIPRTPYNKCFIHQACSVKMSGYWPCSLFACVLMDLDSISVHKHTKKELDLARLHTQSQYIF